MISLQPLWAQDGRWKTEEVELGKEQGYKGMAKRLVSQGQRSLFLQFTSWKLSLILDLNVFSCQQLSVKLLNEVCV